jgi:hypothetical protein
MTQRNQLHCHEEILSVSRQLPQVRLEKGAVTVVPRRDIGYGFFL